MEEDKSKEEGEKKGHLGYLYIYVYVASKKMWGNNHLCFLCIKGPSSIMPS